MTPDSNASGKLTWWLLGLFGTLATGGASAWLTSVHSLSRIHGEKIAVLEVQMLEQKHQLERIDHKLDRLLEQKGAR